MGEENKVIRYKDKEMGGWNMREDDRVENRENRWETFQHRCQIGKEGEGRKGGGSETGVGEESKMDRVVITLIKRGELKEEGVRICGLTFCSEGEMMMMRGKGEEEEEEE